MKRFLSVLALLLLMLVAFSGVSNAKTTRNALTFYQPYGVTVEAKEPAAFSDQSAGWITNTGMNWARMQFHWRTQEPTPNMYDWTSTDPDMAILKAHGLLVDWALQAPPTFDIQSGCTQVPQPQPMANYAVAVFKKYGSQISAMEVGNEEWSYDQTLSCRTATNYISVLEPVVTALRQAGYHGLIGMYGYTNFSTDTQITTWFDSFISDTSNPVSYLDYFNYHYYNDGVDPNNPTNGKVPVMDVPNIIRSLAIKYNRTLRPTWLTEFGWNTNCNDDPNCHVVTTDLQRQYEKEVLVDGSTSGGVLSHAFVYTLRPGTQEKSIYQNGLPLPAATMWQNFSASNPTWH